MIENKFSPKNETGIESQFNWRTYLKNPNQLSPEVISKLDELGDLINGGGKESEEFLKDISKYSQPTLTLINFFRDILTPEEREKLFNEVKKSGPVGFKINHKSKT